eukprot:EG_transcript_54527
MALLRLSPGLALPLPGEAEEFAGVLFRQFLGASGIKVEDVSPEELSLRLLGYLLETKALQAAEQSALVFLEALVRHIHTSVFEGNDVHCFDTADLVAVSREALLTAWYHASAML